MKQHKKYVWVLKVINRMLFVENKHYAHVTINVKWSKINSSGVWLIASFLILTLVWLELQQIKEIMLLYKLYFYHMSASHTIRAHAQEVWDNLDKDYGWLSVGKKSGNPQF